MSRKTRRATAEESREFEKKMQEWIHQATEKESPQTVTDPRNICWLDDSVLATLPSETSLQLLIQYRDTITALADERSVIISAVRTLLERNNLSIVEAFGRKSEKLSVILSGCFPSGQSSDNEDPSSEDSEDSSDKSQGSDQITDITGDAEKSEPSDGDKESEKEDSEKEKDGKAEEQRDEEPAAEESTSRRGRPTRGKGCLDKQCEKLPVVKQVITMSEEELDAIFGKDNWKRLDSNDRVITEYMYSPAALYVKETVLAAYTAKDKEAESVKKEIIVTPNTTERLRQYSRVTSSVWAHIFSDRYNLRLPWERVSSELATSDLILSPQMMEENARYFHGILQALTQRMWFHLLDTGYVQIDETPVLMFDQRQKLLIQRYFWVFTVSELYKTDKPVTLFVYANGRDTEVLRKCLTDDHAYEGYTHTDGHQPYHVLERESGGTIRNTGCLNHFRTRLARVLKVIPGLKNMTEEELEGIPAYRALSALTVVFKAEKETAEMSAEERAEVREKNILPELEKVFDALSDLKADDYPKGSLMYHVLTYRDNQQEYLKRFVEDGNIPITNSNSERHFAFFALLRNVSHLFGSDVMGKVGAGWESLIQTARACTKHVDIYIQHLLDEAVPFIVKEDKLKGVKHNAKSDMDQLERNALSYYDDERLDRFLPWSSEYAVYEKKIMEERREVAALLAGVHDKAGK